MTHEENTCSGEEYTDNSIKKSVKNSVRGQLSTRNCLVKLSGM